MALVAIFLPILFLYSLGAHRITGTASAAPILFTAAGKRAGER